MTDSLPITYPQNGGPSFLTQISVAGDIYAEVPASYSGSDIALSNKGYENDAFYTGDVDGNFSSLPHKSSSSKKNGYISSGRDSLSAGRVSQLYAQPNKSKKRSQASFDDPSWLPEDHNVSSEYGDDNEDVYGYTTTLE